MENHASTSASIARVEDRDVESPADSAVRCHMCAKDRQRCIRKAGSSKCDRCLQMCYSCDDETRTGRKRRKLNYLKCIDCRRDKKGCKPVDRVWPSRCARCVEKDFSCSPPEPSVRTADSPSGKRHRGRSHLSSGLIASAVKDKPTATARSYDDSLPRNNLSGEAISLYSTEEDESDQSRVRERLTSIVDSEMGSPNWRAYPVYLHEPLHGERYTRLIKLLPSNHQSSICECSIHELNLDKLNKELYEGLSYAWSASTRQSFILVRYNQNQTARLPIPQRLEAALRHLRYDLEPRTLWVDQICINMADTAERNRQVKIMGDIYNGASNVCVWLGEGDESSRTAFEFIRNTVHAPALYRNPDWKMPNPNTAALSALMRRPWFSRCWVVQEIGMARRATVYCGDSFVDWSDFADVVSLVATQSSALLEPDSAKYINLTGVESGIGLTEWSKLGAIRLINTVPNLVRKLEDGQIVEKTFSLESLICGLSDFHCSDPRDKVYAFLGISGDATAVIEAEYTVTPKPWNERSGVGVFQTPSPSDGRPTPGGPIPQPVMNGQIWQDYIDSGQFPINYSSTIYEVCTRAVEYAIRKSKSLDIICRHWAPTAARNGPSWLPTRIDAPFNITADGLYERVEADPFVGNGISHSRIYHAAGKTVAQDYKIQEGPGYFSLSVKGFVLDTVGRKGNPAIRAVIPADWMKLGGWEDWRTLPPDTFWRVLVGNRGPNNEKAPGYYQRIFQYLMQQHSGDAKVIELNTEDLINNGRLPLIAKKFLQRVRSVIWSRRLIETLDKGILGLAPRGTKKGDVVCILHGCSVPVVLRRCSERISSGEVYYILIGECYLHGMMDGETQPDHNPSQTFELR